MDKFLMSSNLDLFFEEIRKEIDSRRKPQVEKKDSEANEEAVEKKVISIFEEKVRPTAIKLVEAANKHGFTAAVNRARTYNASWEHSPTPVSVEFKGGQTFKIKIGYNKSLEAIEMELDPKWKYEDIKLFPLTLRDISEDSLERNLKIFVQRALLGASSID